MIELADIITPIPTTAPVQNGLTIGSGSAATTIYSPLRKEITDISSLTDLLLPALFGFAGIILFVMFVYAGYTFMLSEGKADKLGKAQDTFIYAILGFALLIFAFFLTRIVGYIFGLSGGGLFGN